MAGTVNDQFAPAIRRAKALIELQDLLNTMWTPAEQKAEVLRRFNLGLLSKADTQLLFDVYLLAEA